MKKIKGVFIDPDGSGSLLSYHKETSKVYNGLDEYDDITKLGKKRLENIIDDMIGNNGFNITLTDCDRMIKWYFYKKNCEKKLRNIIDFFIAVEKDMIKESRRVDKAKRKAYTKVYRLVRVAKKKKEEEKKNKNGNKKVDK